MNVTTAAGAYRSVKQYSESIKNDGPHKIPTMSVNDAWAQGDIAIVFLGTSLPVGVIEDSKASSQLAPGTTQGSRHCIADISAVKMYRRMNATPLEGPVIDAPNGLTVEHPEHGNITLQEPGFYGVLYQRQYARDELRRVQD